MAEELPLALYDHMRKRGDEPLNPQGKQGRIELRRWRRLFKDELQAIADQPCTLHAHDEPTTHSECFARMLWRLALDGQRWACHLLLVRWQGRVPLTVDLQQNVSIDLTKSLDPSTLARYRWLVQHEDELSRDEVEELQQFRMRSGVPLLAPGDSHDL